MTSYHVFYLITIQCNIENMKILLSDLKLVSTVLMEVIYFLTEVAKQSGDMKFSEKEASQILPLFLENTVLANYETATLHSEEMESL